MKVELGSITGQQETQEKVIRYDRRGRDVRKKDFYAKIKRASDTMKCKGGD